VLTLTGLTSVSVAVRPHASPGFVQLYAGSDAEGPVTFRLSGPGKAGPGRPDYAYELDKLKFATECSRSGSGVPGAILFTHQRRYASEKQHFTYRAAGFVIRGVLYGSFEEPKFRGTVEVHKPHCDGDRLSWTAKLAF